MLELLRDYKHYLLDADESASSGIASDAKHSSGSSSKDSSATATGTLAYGSLSLRVPLPSVCVAERR